MSDDSYTSFGRGLARYQGHFSYARVKGGARWHLAAARGEVQRAAALTAATWQRARRAMVEMLYD